jgi:hypothetical protein
VNFLTPSAFGWWLRQDRADADTEDAGMESRASALYPQEDLTEDLTEDWDTGLLILLTYSIHSEIRKLRSLDDTHIQHTQA